MESGVNLVCFTSCYVIALALEAGGLWVQFRWRRPAILLAAAAGLTAHIWYLGRRIAFSPEAPLSSQHDWFLIGAWLLAAFYFGLVLYRGPSALGLFVMPLALGLIAASPFGEMAPLAGSGSPHFWGKLHGFLLMMGTLAVLLGLVTGVMYLVQSYRLKHKLPDARQLPLPSLEWLERANSRSLGAAAFFVGLGFLTGMILQLATPGEEGIPWTDPVVLSLAAMLAWLIMAEGLRLVYPAARRGRKVAYLTLAAFLFLVVTLISFTMRDSLHQPRIAPEGGNVAHRLTSMRGHV